MKELDLNFKFAEMYRAVELAHEEMIEYKRLAHEITSKVLYQEHLLKIIGERLKAIRMTKEEFEVMAPVFEEIKRVNPDDYKTFMYKQGDLKLFLADLDMIDINGIKDKK